MEVEASEILLHVHKNQFYFVKRTLGGSPIPPVRNLGRVFSYAVPESMQLSIRVVYLS